MHFAFIPYGIKNFMDFVVEDLNHRYLPLRIYKKGEKDKFVLIQSQVRMLPFGIYELVFPKEFMDEVFSAFEVEESLKGEYVKRLDKRIMGFRPMSLLRKMLKLEPIPKYKKVNYTNFPMPEYKKFIAIIPIGVRYDKEITESLGEFAGWTHEAI